MEKPTYHEEILDLTCQVSTLAECLIWGEPDGTVDQVLVDELLDEFHKQLKHLNDEYFKLFPWKCEL